MIQIIPATDIIEGRVVRLTQGDYNRVKVYSDDPLAVARQFEDCGLKRLHIVDLEGAKASSPANLRILERIASGTNLEVQYGGGIKSAEALRSVFSAGAHRAICGSIAVSNPVLFGSWLEEFGSDRLILGADVKHGKVAVKGWLETSALTASELLAQFPGVAHAICTDIARDGMLCGPAADLYVELQRQFPQVEITVSGGIASAADIERLAALGLRSVIVGKAFYEGRITLTQLSALSRHAC